MPTTQQLKQQLDTGKPQDVIVAVGRLLALKGDAAKAYDRYDLFCLRGEACLKNKMMLPAAEAFAAAQKETTDPKKQGEARANELLIRRSRTGGYTPKPAPHVAGTPTSKPAGPMPIVQSADRQAAMAALFKDEMTVVQPRLKAIETSQSLNPVIDAARTLSDLGAIETAATGSSAQTKEIGAKLGDHAHQLIKDAIDKINTQTENIWSSASSSNPNNNLAGNTFNNSRNMRGLTSVDASHLKDIIATCDKITPVAAQLAEVTANDDLKADGEAAKKAGTRP